MIAMFNIKAQHFNKGISSINIVISRKAIFYSCMFSSLHTCGVNNITSRVRFSATWHFPGNSRLVGDCWATAERTPSVTVLHQIEFEAYASQQLSQSARTFPK